MGLAASMVLLALVAYLSLDRPVTRVLVSGPLDGAEQAQIREAVLANLNGGLLSLDLRELEAGVMALDWPRAVAIRRIWPDGLRLEVEKPAVVAGWQDAYLASDGRIVQLPGERHDLPRFECRHAEPRRAMEIYQRLSEAAARDGLTLERLTENELGEWGILLRAAGGAGRVAVTLGAESMQARFERFLVVYRHHLAGRDAEIARVDARYDNGVAVSWRAPDADGALVAARGALPPEAI